ncbi:MAG: DUF72 domain-containing protein [Bacteroidales bacterium]|nr:DUF72 domain-containing protein [Bacteroidales bacterium]
MNWYIGTSGWYYDHWKGIFYPENLPKTKWFEYYKTLFNSVEINATFYRWFKEKTYINWKNQVTDDFRYVLKVPRLITHRKFLKGVHEDILQFSNTARLLDNKLGLLLLQLAPQTHFNAELLQKTLSCFPCPEKLVVEFRDKSWWREETITILQDFGAVFCNVDSPVQEFTCWFTSQTAYFRFHGRKNWYSYCYSEHELSDFVESVKANLGKDVRDVYIFFNNDYEGNAVQNAISLKKIISFNVLQGI